MSAREAHAQFTRGHPCSARCYQAASTCTPKTNPLVWLMNLEFVAMAPLRSSDHCRE